MASYNKVLLMGNLTRDPETRQLPSGTAVCSFSLAVNRRYRTAQGEDREETCFIDIETWGRQAETCGRYLKKGAPALVEGRLKQDRWQDRDTGASRSRILVHAMRVQFLGTPGGGDQPRPEHGQRDDRDRAPASDQDRAPDNDRADRDEPEMPRFEPIESSDDDDIPF